MKTPRVFISMGTPYKPEYRQFRDELERLLRDRCRVDPRIIGKNEYPSGSPLNKIREVMSSCDGALIVAYERKFVEKGLERRGGDEERVISREAYTTIYGRLPPQDDTAGIGGTGCTNLSGLLLERSGSWP